MKYLIAGATGHFGYKLTKFLLKKEENIKIIIRPESLEKKKVKELKELGAVVIEADCTDTDSLKNIFEGIEVLISALRSTDQELNLIKAAKEYKETLKFIIPSIWSHDSTKLEKYENIYFDLKNKIITEVKKSGINYKIIYHGIWLDNLNFNGIDYKNKKIKIFGNQKVQYIHTDDICKLTYEIINDEKQLNKCINLEAVEASNKDVLKIFEKFDKILKVEETTDDYLNEKIFDFQCEDPYNFFKIFKFQSFKVFLIFNHIKFFKGIFFLFLII
jgi:uncharacterized protein YbjT (DUF2867 family)